MSVFKQSEHTGLNARLSFIWTFWGMFGVSFMLFFPVNPQVLPDIQRSLRPLVTPILEIISPIFFETPPIDYTISSDSKAMYLLAFFLLAVSLLTAIASHLFKFRLTSNIRYWIKVIFRYYVAYQLLHYGFNKLFKWQFFLPEPNIAYSQIGEVSKGLLYWSAIGSSYWFTVIVGGLEVITGLLLLFKKTLGIGLMMAFVLFTNIVLVNFGFDISVKLFSIFLFLITVSLFGFDWRIVQAWWQERLHEFVMNTERPTFKKKSFRTYAFTKSLVIGFLIIDSLWIYGKTGNWNDDKQPRPPLHGAYNTILNNVNDWQSVYVNRKGYLIAESDSGIREDYQLHYDIKNNYIMLTRLGDTLNFGYNQTETKLVLSHSVGEDIIVLNKQVYESLPLYRKSFNWWVD